MERYLQKLPTNDAEIRNRTLLQQKVAHYQQVATQLMAQSTSNVNAVPPLLPQTQPAHDDDESISNSTITTRRTIRNSLTSPRNNQLFFPNSNSSRRLQNEDETVVVEAYAIPIEVGSDGGTHLRPVPSFGESSAVPVSIMEILPSENETQNETTGTARRGAESLKRISYPEAEPSGPTAPPASILVEPSLPPPLPPPPTASRGTPREVSLVLRRTLVAIRATASQGHARLAYALDLDEADSSRLAVEGTIQQYMAAVELYLRAYQQADRQLAGDDHATQRSSDSHSELQAVSNLLERRIAQTLDRIEELKKPMVAPASQDNEVLQTRGTPVAANQIPPQTATHVTSREPPPTSTKTAASAGGLTAEEIAILKRSSMIASGLFLPWSDDDALALSRLALQIRQPSLFTSSTPSYTPFRDPAGFLTLNDKQKERFYKWARPHEIAQIRQQRGRTIGIPQVLLVKHITPYTIQQQFVTDCSFIAGLCICSAYERRFRKQLVTNILYPQAVRTSAGNGSTDIVSLLNPEGRYMVKLWLNGVARVVVIDDYLPIDKYGNLLCSQTSKTTDSYLELWVCLIEKAYMKLSGGYHFPGSNSGVDLFSLTGWIPERYACCIISLENLYLPLQDIQLIRLPSLIKNSICKKSRQRSGL
jgi:Calpain family cysteine protease